MMGFSLLTVPSATLGLFIDPLHREFGWSSTEISLGLTIFALFSLPLSPVAGAMADRFDVRRLAVPGMIASALLFAAFSQLDGSLLLWVALWTALTLASLLIRTMVWTKAVSASFIISRGLAIAVLLSGSALAQTLTPLLSRWIIDSFGWREAYLALGLGWGGFAALLVLLFFRPILGLSQPTTHGVEPSHTIGDGLTFRQALRNAQMYRIVLAVFLQSTMAVAIMVHLVPMLSASGVSRSNAAGFAAFFGVAATVGQLANGWLVDRTDSRVPHVACYLAPALAYYFLLQQPQSTELLALVIFLLGYACGAASHLAPFLTTRYAGLRAFGTIFGVIESAMALAAGIGPILAGIIFDRTGNYSGLLMVGMAEAVVAAIVIAGLGPPRVRQSNSHDIPNIANQAVPDGDPAIPGADDPREWSRL